MPANTTVGFLAVTKAPTMPFNNFTIHIVRGQELAGVSGNVDAVTDALRKGKPLMRLGQVGVYVQGFRMGDPGNVAILWESKPGLYYDGRKNDFGGRAVLLLNGDITNVPAADWAGFLKQQGELSKVVQSNRITSTNAPAPAAH